MNILSLFDGISVGQEAINSCMIGTTNYFASEIDPKAIAVTQKNFPHTIQVGDVLGLSASDFPKIDLLLGGSPCQGFSFAGKQLNFDDPRSKLFFEYVRLLKECKPKYFFLENVMMKKEYQDVISKTLGVPTLKLNSNMYVAQNRKRLYWTNIPLDFDAAVGSQRDKNFRDIIDLNSDHEYVEGETVWFDDPSFSSNGLKILGGIKSPTSKWRFPDPKISAHLRREQRIYSIDGKIGCLTTHNRPLVLDQSGRIRKVSKYELERLQGLPDGYCGDINPRLATKLLGNSWTMPVVRALINSLRYEFGI